MICFKFSMFLQLFVIKTVSLTFQNSKFYGTNHTNRIRLGVESRVSGDMSAGRTVFFYWHALRAGAAFSRDGAVAFLV